MKKFLAAVLIIVFVIVLDQWLKIWIKLNFSYGEGFNILGLSWAQIHFVENAGMAFGMELGGEKGKLILSLFRIVLVGFLVYLLIGFIKANESLGFIIAFSLIIAGAVGNIIDSVLYGIIFSESSYHGPLAIFLPVEGGYAPIFYGKVVDMFYFPLIDTILPDWIPYFGGKRFEFFRPVFNIADSSISIGVSGILLFYRKYFTKDTTLKK